MGRRMEEEMKAEILSPLKLDDMLDGKQVKLSKPFTVRIVEHLDDGEMIEIRLITAPQGFVSDLASVPRFLQGVFPRFGRYNAAAIIHDWLYVSGKIEGEWIERATADRIFLAVMKASRCGWRKRTMFIAVRMFGKHLWDSHGHGKK